MRVTNDTVAKVHHRPSASTYSAKVSQIIPSNMEFIENEEALGLCPAEPDAASSVPSEPFPFLKLPREIRDSIYYYALLHPNTGPTVNPTDICFMRHQEPDRYSTAYWGTEKSTHLFRVNRQVSDEALEMFYSSFSFHFPNYVDVALVNATLRDTLSAGARSLISSIGLVTSLFLRRTPGPFAHSDDEKVRQAFEAVVKLLPNVRRVQLTLSLGGFKVPDYQVKEVVTRAMRKASPLRDIAGLVLGGTTETAQRMRIMSEVREALGCL